ncbi:MAG: glycoside hydrolase family protein [Microcoleaceae cyanobacterium]
MERQIKIFDDGYVHEIEDGKAILSTNTNGEISKLIEVLEFTKAEKFTVERAEVSFGDSVPTYRNSRRQTGSAGVNMIKSFEGLHLDAYYDAVGIPTIGYGHIEGVYMGMSISEAEAEELLRKDLERFEVAVQDAAEVEINDDQFDALVSFSFNLGAGSLFSSTLLKLLNKGKFEQAAEEFPRWNKAGGQALLGLTRRRLSERALFLSKPWQFYKEYDLLELTSPKMQGEYVRQVQQALQKAGCSLNVNGVFDEATDRAAKQFQEKQGWYPDGLVGPKTVAALNL